MAKQAKRNGGTPVDSTEAGQSVPLGPNEIDPRYPRCASYGIAVTRTIYGRRVTDESLTQFTDSLRADVQKIVSDLMAGQTRDSSGWYPEDVERMLYNMERIQQGKPEDNRGFD